MSFELSTGTLETMAGIFAPSPRGRGGASGRGGSSSRSALTMMSSRAGGTVKQAFGGGGPGAVSRRAVATLDRTARRVPEVMVRITGRQSGSAHVLANFSYISRLGHGAEREVELHTSDGDVLHDARDMRILAQDWHEWEAGDNARRQGSTSISMVLSMPAGTDPERLQAAALAFAREEMANRSWVAALHQDRDHPHVHLTIARRDHDGRRFQPGRDDLLRYRQRFAEKLREHGIEANATPAKARGADAVHEPIAVRKVREKGGVATIDLNRRARLEQLRGAGMSDPAGALIGERHGSARAVYERSISELSGSPDPLDRDIARSLARFAASLPTPGREQEGRGDASLPGEVGAEDVLAAALDRLQQSNAAASERMARRNGETAQDANRSQSSPVPDTQRAAVEHSAESAEAHRRRIEEIARQVDAREKARRERERTRGRDGPER